MRNTRRIENPDGIVIFVEIFQPIVEFLGKLQIVRDITKLSKALKLC